MRDMWDVVQSLGLVGYAVASFADKHDALSAGAVLGSLVWLGHVAGSVLRNAKHGGAQ